MMSIQGIARGHLPSLPDGFLLLGRTSYRSPSSHERHAQRRKLDSQGKMAGGCYPVFLDFGDAVFP
ncbi:hypothetical protein ACCT30_37485, partial [Rhizobium ruizarguesonis]